MRAMRKLFLLSALLVIAPCAFAQQDVADPAADARIRLGPLALTPTFSLINAGIDTNVFNEPDQAGPKRDFAMTLEPKTDWWLRMGRTWFLGNVTGGLVYYNKYENQRSINGLYRAGWLVPMTRLTLRADGSYLRTRDRPGFEIDARAQRSEVAVDGSLEIRALSKTFVGLKANRQNVKYAKDALFFGQNLRDGLNRTVTAGAVTFRHQITPLTSLTLDVGKEQTRFQLSPLRDSDSTAIVAGVKFDPFALVKGSATFGYRDFEPLVPGLPKYKGTTAAVDLTYLGPTSTKLTVKGMRDLQYSYDINQPYYLQTGVTGEVMQRIFGPLDVVGRAGIARLEYRDRIGAEVPVSNRVDTIHIYGGGVGYRIGKDFRVGVNVDQQKRDSQAALRQYDGLRYGTSLTYGF